ncbi:hypothetical protein Q4Q39_02675 [Flavivirga amylovorans]|uniref:DUF342 domain-containing protein n=1 Tax=Flavivirga amylovorans TaxID=870486 RepID=A0ABT8WX91_9FLAO|nr:hypothetical protein [Flavivirga amylovorans]MDO5986298.1 hypothetical protein [Flavivirga amylovorans]
MMLQKIKAGALQFTMFIVVVIALLLTACIILIDTHKRFNIQTDFVLETIENTNKGIDYVLQNKTPLSDSITINLEDEDYKTVSVHRDYWGVFEKVIAIATIKTNRFKKVALIGALQPKINRTSLYVEDKNKPLVLVGNTKIRGVAYLPKQGVRTGNISGHSFYGNQLIYGVTRTSSKLPELLDETRNQIKTIQNQIGTINQNQFLDLNRSNSFKNSFLNPLQVIYSHTDVHLIGVSLKGHILVQSKTKIIVDANSNLKDIVLVAPEIEIKSNTKGTFQAIATKGITIGKNCTLNYPSALILNEDLKNKIPAENTNNQKQTPLVKVAKGSTLKGFIVYLGETKNYKAQVFIDDQALILGEIYCNRNLELLGTVYGSVFVSNFIANQSGSSYQNHIYNGTIIVDDLAQEYIGLSFKNSKKGVMTWLY